MSYARSYVDRPCWTCHYYVAMVAGGSAAECSAPIGPRIRAQPERGCVGYVREPGSDDEPGQPPCAGERPQLRPVSVTRPPVEWAP